MPGTRCTVSVCNNSTRKTRKDPSLRHIKYHTFPKDAELQKKWAILCCRKGKWKPEACHVCSEHFKPDDYARDLQAELLKLPPRKVLKNDAVPSIGLGWKDSPKSSELAEKRAGRQERRTNKKIVDQLLLKKYDQDVKAPLQCVNISSEDDGALGVAKIEEMSTDMVDDQQVETSEEFVVEYLEDADNLTIEECVVKPEPLTSTCNRCGTLENLRNEHDLLKHQYNALTMENRELGSKLERSEGSVQLHKSKLKELQKELATLRDNRAKEHMIVQSKCDDGMYEVFVVMNNEGNK